MKSRILGSNRSAFEDGQHYSVFVSLTGLRTDFWKLSAALRSENIRLNLFDLSRYAPNRDNALKGSETEEKLKYQFLHLQP